MVPQRCSSINKQGPGVPITPEKEQEIIAALEKDSHASRVARTLGDVSYATVWRVAERYAIALKAGRETMGRPPTGGSGRKSRGSWRRTRMQRRRSWPEKSE